MAEDLANEIIRASRGMRTMQMAIMKKRRIDQTIFVSGAKEGETRRFVNFCDANNYLYAQGFHRVLDGEEERFWKERFFSMTSTGTRPKFEVIIYSRKAPQRQ
jgi:hypothetical protein